jgi:putative GTP pyrophosphokinase
MDDLELQYHSHETVWRRLEDEVKFILDSALRGRSIKIHSLVSRIKSLNSIRDKAARKNSDQPIDTLEDLVGVRVVCLLRSDITRIGDIVRNVFEVVAEDNKLDGAEVDVFGYQSVHFIAQLPASCSGPRYEGLHKLRFELQLRTLAMDAWASLSHYLDYKNESDVPRELRKDFFALSGLFYVADTHFELFYAERQKSKKTAQQSVTVIPNVDQELNLDTLSAYLRKRYPDRKSSGLIAVSQLVGELANAGYTTLDKLHKALEASVDAFKLYEKKHPPGSKNSKFLDSGVVRVSLAILDPIYADSIYSADDEVNKFRQFVKTC